MTPPAPDARPPGLRSLSYQIWILAAGRLLLQIGTGFTLFYAPIFFVNEVGLSPTAVGLGLGSGSISGVLGRFLGGTASDSPRWGRRKILLISALVSALADVFLALADNFPLFVVGNLLMGLGIGLYWPATEAAVADLTKPEQRSEAFAIARLADSIGLGVGVILGGLIISTTQAYRSLFVVDGISFVVFFGVVYAAIAETNSFHEPPQRFRQSWATALGDRRLMIFVVVNVLFTTYLAQINSTLPLYFSNFLSLPGRDGFAPATISALFTWHVVLAALIQLPIARRLAVFSRPQALTVSMLLWGVGFLLVGLTGVAAMGHLVWAILALSIQAVAMAAYTPSASALVVEYAPASLRGVYLSINSQCWAIGYFVGPPLGGWALDQSKAIADGFWLVLALTVGVGVAILQVLSRLQSAPHSPS